MRRGFGWHLGVLLLSVGCYSPEMQDGQSQAALETAEGPAEPEETEDCFLGCFQDPSLGNIWWWQERACSTGGRAGWCVPEGDCGPCGPANEGDICDGTCSVPPPAACQNPEGDDCHGKKVGDSCGYSVEGTARSCAPSPAGGSCLCAEEPEESPPCDTLLGDAAVSCGLSGQLTAEIVNDLHACFPESFPSVLTTDRDDGCAIVLPCSLSSLELPLQDQILLGEPELSCPEEEPAPAPPPGVE